MEIHRGFPNIGEQHLTFYLIPKNPVRHMSFYDIDENTIENRGKVDTRNE